LDIILHSAYRWRLGGIELKKQIALVGNGLKIAFSHYFSKEQFLLERQRIKKIPPPRVFGEAAVPSALCVWRLNKNYNFCSYSDTKKKTIIIVWLLPGAGVFNKDPFNFCVEAIFCPAKTVFGQDQMEWRLDSGYLLEFKSSC